MSRIDENRNKCDHQDIQQGMKGVHGVRVQVFMDKSQELGFFLCVLQYPYYNCKCSHRGYHILIHGLDIMMDQAVCLGTASIKGSFDVLSWPTYMGQDNAAF